MKRFLPILLSLLIPYQLPTSSEDSPLTVRKDWNMAEVKTSYERVLREQWVPGTCKGL